MLSEVRHSKRKGEFIYKRQLCEGERNYEEMAFQFDTNTTKLLTMNDKSDMTFELQSSLFKAKYSGYNTDKKNNPIMMVTEVKH